MPLPPEEENGENAANEEPKLQFSYVECLLFSFHQLGKKLPDFLIDKISTDMLKDFKIRSVIHVGSSKPVKKGDRCLIVLLSLVCGLKTNGVI